MPDTRLSFKEMCAQFDVTPRTLRYYEYIELLAPEKDGRARWYAAREVARMKLILRGRKFGFSLEEIRQWLLMYQQKGTKPQLQSFVELADRQLAVLVEQQDQLMATMIGLREITTAVADGYERLSPGQRRVIDHLLADTRVGAVI